MTDFDRITTYTYGTNVGRICKKGIINKSNKN